MSAASSCGVTFNSVALATLGALLHKHSGKMELALMQTYLGRSSEHIDMVGSFSVSLPMVLSFAGNPPIGLICREVFNKTVDIMGSMCRQSTHPDSACSICYEYNVLTFPFTEHMLPTNFPRMCDIFFTINHYSDSMHIMVLYDSGMYSEAGIAMLVSVWVESWECFDPAMPISTDC